jgi:hypothetical protein
MNEFNYGVEAGMAYSAIKGKIASEILKMERLLGDRTWAMRVAMDEREMNCEMFAQNIAIYEGLNKRGFKVSLNQVSNLNPHRNFTVTKGNEEWCFRPNQF